MPARGGVESLLLAGTLRELKLQLPARLVEQAGDVLRAEQVEFRTGGNQRQEILGRQLVAEAVFNRQIDVGGWPPGGDRTDREALPGPQAEDGILGHRHLARLPRLNLAGFNQVEVADITGVRANDLAAGRIKRNLRLFGETLQCVRLHFVERRMIAKKCNGVASHAATPLFAQRHLHLANDHFLPCLLLRIHDNLIFFFRVHSLT